MYAIKVNSTYLETLDKKDMRYRSYVKTVIRNFPKYSTLKDSKVFKTEKAAQRWLDKCLIFKEIVDGFSNNDFIEFTIVEIKG